MKVLITISFLALSSQVFASVPKISAFPEGERLVYSRLVESYRRTDLPGVRKQLQLLQKNYPHSVHLDNAYYLTGVVEFQSNRLGEALKSFSVVREKFPRSNKRPAALFAMATTYKRLNLVEPSRRVFKQVLDEYPGSPESQRAWMTLKLAKDGAQTKK